MVAIYVLIQLDIQCYIPCVMNQMGFIVAIFDWPSFLLRFCGRYNLSSHNQLSWASPDQFGFSVYLYFNLLAPLMRFCMCVRGHSVQGVKYIVCL